MFLLLTRPNSGDATSENKNAVMINPKRNSITAGSSYCAYARTAVVMAPAIPI